MAKTFSAPPFCRGNTTSRAPLPFCKYMGLVTNYLEGGKRNGRGGAYEVLPPRKGGAEKVLAMLKGGGGGHKQFEVVLTWDLEV